MLGSKCIPLCSAVALYLMLFYAIFSVYYTSPLVRGTQPIPLNITPPATHLIFIVSDGLRADQLFTADMPDTPFIKNLLLNVGAWGLSHTRVPTESRPGHVAMLGGFYEDVASVTKGWQANAVEFDSILNRSARAWAWGSHDIVQPFYAGQTTTPHFSAISSPSELNDLAKENITAADRWTVDRFLEHGFFSPTEPTLEGDHMHTLRRGRMAFLYLMAADLVGHAHKPGSSEYRNLLRHLDSMVKEVVEAVQKTSDGLDVRPAFILTSDHGMTDWGSHGAGSFAETATPLLVWGSGLVGPSQLPDNDPRASQVAMDQDGLPVHIGGRLRREVKQADLCPLMAGLLGAPIPVNSVGHLPLELIIADNASKATLARANALQLLAQVKLKREEARAGHFKFLFKDFIPLFSKQQKTESKKIEKYEHLFDASLAALTYFHKYDRLLLGFCIATTYFLWSVIILCTLIGPVELEKLEESHDEVDPLSLLRTVIRIILIGLAIIVLAFAHRSPLMHSLCQLVPIALAFHLVHCPKRRGQISQLFKQLYSLGTNEAAIENEVHSHTSRHQALLVYAAIALLAVLILECLIWGFHYRPLLSVACLLVACWPLVDQTFGMNRPHLRRLWPLACVGMSIFPLLPVIGSVFSPTLVLLTGLSAVPVGLSCFHWLCGSSASTRLLHNVTPTTYILGLLACVFVAVSSMAVWLVHLDPSGFPLLRTITNVYSGCMLLFPPLAVLIWFPPRLGLRLYGWILAYLIPYTLLSTGYEIVFFVVFMSVGLLWIQLEACNLPANKIWSLPTNTGTDQKESEELPSESGLNLRNFRQSILFIFLLLVSFFGTGNIASLNSFDPRSTYCFITQVQPAVMGLLLVIKILCPMLCLSLIYVAVELASNHHAFNDQRTTITLINATQTGLCWIMSNFIAVHFFAWLQDEGSWLEIGTSISHYVIAMAVGLISVLFSTLGRQMFRVHLTRQNSVYQQVTQKNV